MTCVDCFCTCRISPDGSTLTVTATHTSDSGKYTCLATNKAGEEDKVFNLNVYGKCKLQLTIPKTYLIYHMLRKEKLVNNTLRWL